VSDSRRKKGNLIPGNLFEDTLAKFADEAPVIPERLTDEELAAKSKGFAASRNSPLPKSGLTSKQSAKMNARRNEKAKNGDGSAAKHAAPAASPPWISIQQYQDAWEAYVEIPTAAHIRRMTDLPKASVLRVIGTGWPEFGMVPLRVRYRDLIERVVEADNETQFREIIDFANEAKTVRKHAMRVLLEGMEEDIIRFVGKDGKISARDAKSLWEMVEKAGTLELKLLAVAGSATQQEGDDASLLPAITVEALILGE